MDLFYGSIDLFFFFFVLSIDLNLKGATAKSPPSRADGADVTWQIKALIEG